MAHNNLFNYGLGYYGSSTCCGGSPTKNCEDDMYGCCTTPGGPGMPNLEYNRPKTGIVPFTKAEQVQMIAQKKWMENPKNQAMMAMMNKKPPHPHPHPHPNYGKYYMPQDTIGVL